MLSVVAIGLMLGLGTAAWVYTKVMRMTGGNTKQSVIMAVLAGVVGFVLVATTMSILDDILG